MTRPVRPPELPALVVGRVSHTRHRPVRHRFAYRHYQWLVDLDDLPRLRWPLSLLGRFDARDHLGSDSAGRGIRADLEDFLEQRGVVLRPEDRVLMLAHARSLGHTFDPLSVFWCVAPDGSPRAVVAEVHNTYGGRHAYLLDLDGHGVARQEKEFYVSPFNDVSGEYTIRLRLGPDRVAVAIGLDREGVRILDAAVVGTPVPATPRTVLGVAARHLVMTYRVSALIRLHGVRLWLRRLPVVPRPAVPQELIR